MSVTCQVLAKEAPGSSPAAPLPSQQQLRSFEGRGVRKGEALSLGPSMESLQVILCRAPPTPPTLLSLFPSGVLLSMGFGFVEYKKPEQAQKALKQLQVSQGFWAITVRPWPKKD